MKEHTFCKETSFLVTGGAGFIGANLIEALLKRGYKVRAIDDFSSGKRENVAELKGTYKFDSFDLIEGSICDFATCEKACKGIDYVLHQAAWGSVAKSIEFPLLYDTINVHGTLNLMEASLQAGVKKFVYASSSAIYGDEPSPRKREGHEGNPLCPYALTKKINEMYARIYYDLYGLNTIGLRYFNVYGPRQDPYSTYAAVIPIFVKSLALNLAPTIYGDGTQTRDFTYIDDVVEANLKACLASDEANGQVFNIAYGKSICLNDLYQKICSLLAKEIKPVHAPFRSGDIRHSAADITKAREVLAYHPQYDINEGLALTINWFTKHLQ